MRSALILLCVALQLGVLGHMVYGRESVVADGQRIYMATAPIDPRDPFRGDFVRLRYPANNINSAPGQWSSSDKALEKGDVVYALLEQKPSGLYEAVLFTDTPPESGLYIRGRSTSVGSAITGRSQPRIRFGIEQLFVQQGGGIAIEKKRGIRGGLQTAIEVEIAVGKNGTAILTDYRWSDLGIQIELTDNFRLRAADAEQRVQSASGDDLRTDNNQLILSIQNVSENPITLNNPGDNCGFRLEPANRNSSYSEAANSCTDLNLLAPLTLAPEQKHLVEIDLANPRWFVEFNDNDSVTTGDLRTFNSTQMVRIVYRGAQAILPLNSSADSAHHEFWRGDLLSQGFNARGRID